MMFDRVTTKYAAVVASAYGISLSDIGYQSVTSGGETLAGSIRQERRMKRTGFSRLKKKLSYFFNEMLPEHLEFTWIDMDDELSVAIGRARLSSAQAYKELIANRIFTPKEARLQMVADGLWTVPVPDDIPEDELPEIPMLASGNGPNTRDMMSRPVPASQGGHGEVKNSLYSEVEKAIFSLADGIENDDLDIVCGDIDYDNAIVDYIHLVPDAEQDEFRSEIRSELERVWSKRFNDRKSEMIVELKDFTKLGRMGFGYVADELKNMRYNIVEDFENEVNNIARRFNNGNGKDS